MFVEVVDMNMTPAIGDEENEIPEGTLFEKLPEEGLSDCGEEKTAFY